jgi:hypothetical protein
MPSQTCSQLCNRLLHNRLSSGVLVPSPAYLTLKEVITRYRGQVSEGTLRNWRAMRIGPSFIKIGKAVLYPASKLDRWDKFNLVVCRPSRSLSLEEYASAG